MKSIELLDMLKEDAKIYRKDSLQSLARNSHMNEVRRVDLIKQPVIDAVLVDFINFVASKHCVDYSLYTKDLEK